MRVEIGRGSPERDDADESPSRKRRLDPRAAELGEEKREVGEGVGDAVGSVE